MRAIKKALEKAMYEEYTEADVMFIEFLLTFGLVFFVLAEFARVFIR